MVNVSHWCPHQTNKTKKKNEKLSAFLDICQIVKAMLVTEIDVHGWINQINYAEKFY